MRPDLVLSKEAKDKRFHRVASRRKKREEEEEKLAKGDGGQSDSAKQQGNDSGTEMGQGWEESDWSSSGDFTDGLPSAASGNADDSHDGLQLPIMGLKRDSTSSQASSSPLDDKVLQDVFKQEVFDDIDVEKESAKMLFATFGIKQEEEEGAGGKTMIKQEGSYETNSSSISHSMSPELIRERLLLQLHEITVDFGKMALSLKHRLNSGEDWDALLKQNQRFYLNLIFGLYLSSEDGGDQVSWLKTKSTADCQCTLDLFKFDSAASFMCGTLNLFNNDLAMQNAYLGFANSLKLNFPLDPSMKRHLAEALFFYRGKLVLQDPVTVWQECLAAIHKLCSNGGQSLPVQSLSDIGQTLDAMSLLFDYSGLAGEDLPEYSKPPQAINNRTAFMGLTTEEDKWLVAKKDEVMYIMESVDLGTDITADVFNFTFLGMPLNPQFGFFCTSAYMERMWKFFGLHCEFDQLSYANQVLLVQNSVNTYWACLAAKLHGMPMVTQVAFMHSENEITSDTSLKRILDSSKPGDPGRARAIRVEDMFPTIPAKPFDDYCDRVKHLMRRDDDDNVTFFSLMALSVIGSVPAHDPAWSGMRALAKKYELIVARKFAAKHEASQLYSAVSDLRVMAAMFPPPIQ